jgi:hypothetical protein
MKIKGIGELYNLRNLLLFLAAAVCVLGFVGESVRAQCAPVYYQKTFQKVYRQQKIFLEGLADLTGDGKPDAYGYQLQPNNTFQNIIILPNDGSGGFGNPVIVNTTFPVNNETATINSRFYGSVVTGDLNLDGKLDLAVHSATSPKAVFTFINNGGNSFTQQSATTIGDNEKVFQIADINGDGRGDLISVTVHPMVTTEFPNVIGLSYRLQNSDGSFASAVLLVTSQYISPIVADLNSDGKIDFAYSYYFSVSDGGDNSYRFKTLTNLGGGIFSGSTATVQNVDIHGVSDFNGDGKPDILARDTKPVVFINDGAGNFTRIDLPTTPAETFSTNFLYQNNRVFAVDLDGDGDKDILDDKEGRDSGLGRIRRKYYSTYINNGSGVFTRANFDRPFIGLPVDINADNKADDVVFVNSTQGTPRPSATNEAIVVVKQSSCAVPTPSGQTKLIDFTGDGVSDVVTWRASNGQWNYQSNVYDNSFNWGLGSLGDVPAPGDYDGDGKTDATVYRNSTGVWYILQSSVGTPLITQFGVSGDIPVPGDYNGDGKSDIAVFRPSDGNWYILLSGASQIIITHFGASGDQPVQQDYDGDGKFDLAVFRASTGVWYYLKSSDGSFTALQWGISTDKPVPADFDSDGKADVTVYRDGTWYILRSFDAGVDIVQFGLAGDIPMAVDSNGDGIIELSVYRSSSRWYASAQPQFFWADFVVTGNPVRTLLPNN